MYKQASLKYREALAKGGSGVDLRRLAKPDLAKAGSSKGILSRMNQEEAQSQEEGTSLEEMLMKRFTDAHQRVQDAPSTQERFLAMVAEQQPQDMVVKASFDAPADSVPTQTKGLASKPQPEGDVGVRLKQDIQEIFGLTDYQAAAIAGNLDHETGSFKFMQELNPMVEGSRGGYGFAQWTGQRRKAFEAWAKENDLDPSSYDANLGFLVHEFQTDKYFQKILGRLEKTKNVDEATKVFSDGYLKPGIPKMDSRLEKSRGYVGK